MTSRSPALLALPLVLAVAGGIQPRAGIAAKVAGSAVIRAGGRVVARCRIGAPASVRLALRGA
jgi:hypothetical protein